ncbi:MAG: hypothetical protein H6707_03590 [Deltaproteobacteria bacterium]|nr:hypothetical protein [Deltaproteobacteria bacterium]
MIRKSAIKAGLAVVASALYVVSIGASGDGGCGGGKVKTAQELCTSSGGKWDDSACPLACWPPKCGEPVNQACTANCGSEPVCRCPSNKPYWTDGKGCQSISDCNLTACKDDSDCQALGQWCGYISSTERICKDWQQVGQGCGGFVRPEYLRRCDPSLFCKTNPQIPDLPGVCTAPECTTDADCKLFSNYCGGCNCDALKASDPFPSCPNPPVNCFVDPCMQKVAKCNSKRCIVASSSTN